MHMLAFILCEEVAHLQLWCQVSAACILEHLVIQYDSFPLTAPNSLWHHSSKALAQAEHIKE